MNLNPFKEANLQTLQEGLLSIINKRLNKLIDILDEKVTYIQTKGRKRVTLMIVPHSEKKIVHIHISNYVIFFTSVFFIAVISITSFMIINHSSTIKEVSRLEIYEKDSKVMIQKYKEEINKLYDTFQTFKPELAYLYSLTPDNYVDTLWAKGGASDSKLKLSDENSVAPSIEELNIQEMDQELKTTQEVLKNVKLFLKKRKKIIENTPSIWPVKGYIISSFGQRVSPYTFKDEFNYGIDIASYPGEEIKASAPGTIEEVEWDPVYGLTVSVRHKYGFMTKYSHCHRVSVKPEQQVSKGEVIGYVGKTGKTNGHILHYRIKIGTDYVDPLPYLNNIDYSVQ